MRPLGWIFTLGSGSGGLAVITASDAVVETVQVTAPADIVHPVIVQPVAVIS